MNADTTVLWRVNNDSSRLTSPRALIRVFTGPGTLEDLAAHYERVQGVERDMWFTYPAKRLALAVVGGFLLIEGEPAALEPFREVDGTLLVNDAGAHLERLTAEGGEVLDPLHSVPTGAGFTARHPDGSVVEYVEHRPDAQGR
ncbi:hypothetical protein [Streptomyces sp. NBC_01353]|uniref:hypothetical protein n=1 Tax=Streptomyces sp. NBC_01353 TaxID=2903835 RepID=UPI002E312F7C|nr:hypothetical protein [Streptomyces sp. NBC_01353]